MTKLWAVVAKTFVRYLAAKEDSDEWYEKETLLEFERAETEEEAEDAVKSKIQEALRLEEAAHNESAPIPVILRLNSVLSVYLVPSNSIFSASTREVVADVQHQIWAHWMTYLFSICPINSDGSVTIPAKKVERWTTQANIAYSDLTEKEKDSDRHEADKVLAVISNLGEGNYD